MVQEKHLKELFKYIEQNWDVCVSQVDKTDIKRIFGGVLCEDIMNNTLHEVKAEPALNPIAEAYERGEKIRQKNWLKDAWIQKLSETESTSDTLTTFSNNWDFATHPENWELYTEPTEQHAKPFDKDRFERLFCAVVASGVVNGITYDESILQTKLYLTQLDAYYAKKGGSNG